MLKDRTDLVNILKTVMGGVVCFVLFGCGKTNSFNYRNDSKAPQYQSHILGGKQIDPMSSFGKKIIYLAIGVQKQLTTGGLVLNMRDQCTAAAITPYVLLTAGHCLESIKSDEIYAVLGGDPWVNHYNESNWHEVESFLIHEDFKNDEKNGISENDLALIKLKKPLSLDYVLPLATTSDVLNLNPQKLSLDMLEIGFGVHDIELSKNSGNEEQTLNYAMKTFDRIQLQKSKIEIEQRDAVGFCMGDSGGPGLIATAENQLKILAVASHIKTNRLDRENAAVHLEQPCRGIGVYTNLLFQLNWIQKTLAGLK